MWENLVVSGIPAQRWGGLGRLHTNIREKDTTGKGEGNHLDP